VNTLTPHALVTPDALIARMKRTEGAEDDVDPRIIAAINASTHWLEMVTRRKLRARNHRTAVTISCTGSSGAVALAGSGFTASVEAGDDMVGSGLAVGAQVDSITSNTALNSTRPHTAAVNGSVTFGSRPIRLSGDGGRELWLPERPIVEVFSIYHDDGGTLTALDLTDAFYEYETGRMVLVNDTFPKGTLNLVVNARLGYVAPTATDLGSQDWYALESAAMRAAEVFYLDALSIRGRNEDFSVGSASARIGTAPVPADLMGMVMPFLRRW
jgi:hypothetical protein